MDEDDGKKWRDHECGTSPHFSHSPLNFARVRRRSPGVTPEPWRSCGLKQPRQVGVELSPDIPNARKCKTEWRTPCSFDSEQSVKQFVQFVACRDDFAGRKKAQKSQKGASVFAHFVPFCGQSLCSPLVAAPPRWEMPGLVSRCVPACIRVAK